MISFADIARVLRKELSGNRYRHSLAVARLAGELADIHGGNVSEARLCGLVHDCAKEWSPKKLIAHVNKRKLRVPALGVILATAPNLLHAYVSADVARSRKWISSRAAVLAVSAHTLGRVPMTMLDSIVFIADLASYDRRFPGVRRVRQVARADLRAGLRAALAVKLGHQLRKQKRFHPMPIAVWNGLLDRK